MSRPATLGSAVLGATLLAVAPRPGEALQVLGNASGSVADPTAPVLAAVSLAAWALTGYLLLAAVLVAGGRLPGLLGRCAGALAAAAVPRALRTTLEVVLGAGLVLGAAGPAVAGEAAPGRGAPGPAATATVSLDWPIVAPPAPAAAPVAAPPAVTTRAVPPTAAPAVVVRPGDTLWGLAERSLRSTGVEPTDAAVAATWPSWWAANREVVGDDPHLLRPGTPLVAPPAS